MDQTPEPVMPSSFSQPLEEKDEHPDGGFSSWIGKILFFSFLTVLFVGGGFYIGTQTMKQAKPTPTPTAIPSPATSPTQSFPSPSPAFEQVREVKAGLTENETFSPYTLALPPSWTDARETTVVAGLDKLTLTKEGYTVTIYQAPMEGKGCVYPEDPASTFAQTFSDFADINGSSGQFRRSWNSQEAQTTTYTICQKGPDDSYGTITQFGAITVVTPNPANQATLIEIDGIIASLIKQ